MTLGLPQGYSTPVCMIMPERNIRQRNGGMLWLIQCPNGKKNFFHRLMRQAASGCFRLSREAKDQKAGNAKGCYMFRDLRKNRNIQSIILNMLIAAVSLFVNGFGVYLTIQANLGAAPWDVLNLGLSRSLHILYGNASIAVSFTILVIDILLKEPIGIAMFIDAVVVGKAVDYFNWVHAVPACDSLVTGIPVMFAGLVILAYTQYTYMIASLGCGPRDTLLVDWQSAAGRFRSAR